MTMSSDICQSIPEPIGLIFVHLYIYLETFPFWCPRSLAYQCNIKLPCINTQSVAVFYNRTNKLHICIRIPPTSLDSNSAIAENVPVKRHRRHSGPIHRVHSWESRPTSSVKRHHQVVSL